MDKQEIMESLENDFLDFAAEYPNSALSLVTGLFVGLLEFSVEQEGGDSGAEIKIDSNGKRDITLHARAN